MAVAYGGGRGGAALLHDAVLSERADVPQPGADDFRNIPFQ